MSRSYAQWQQARTIGLRVKHYSQMHGKSGVSQLNILAKGFIPSPVVHTDTS